MTDRQDRIVTLDVIRGVAVMGILVMNIVAFAMPFPAYANPAAYGGHSGIDLISWAFDFLLFDGKMRSLFSILFGASTLLVIDRASRSGRSAAATHYARIAVLLLFGCLHFYFLWFGDILALYALTGMILYWLRDVSVRNLVVWAIMLMFLSNAFYGMVGATAIMANSPRVSAQAGQGMMEARNAIEQETGAASKKIPADLDLYRGSYSEIVAHRLGRRTLEPFQSVVTFGAETLGLMMIGMALFRSGFLTGEWQPARYRRWAIILAVLALPPLAGLAWWQHASGFDSGVVFTSFIALSQPFDLMMAIAWAAVTVLWLKRSGGAALKARVAATGRMAFTNYLTTSLVMSTIFYGYGLGLFGHVGRASLWLFVIGMWGLMLLWSKPWLDRFRYGPLEWVWRSLARGRLQPMRKSA